MKCNNERNIMNPWCKCWPNERVPLFLKPFLLLVLFQHESHGYELFDSLKRMGFNYTLPNGGYIYKKLRKMEADGLINSRWDTERSGPARRIYRITPKGIRSLTEWAKSLEGLKSSLSRFLKMYKETVNGGIHSN